MSDYTKAQLIMHLTERDAEVKALHEKLGRLELECAELRGQLRRTRLEANAEVKEMGDKLAEFAQKNTALEYEVKATKREAPKRQARSPEAREAFLAEAKRRSELAARCSALSRKYNAVGRVRDGVIELYSRRRGAWIAAPSDM